MIKDGTVLGIDTSNYTTSAAITDKSGNVIRDCRQQLAVREGRRGLRQSEALFQHVDNLPDVLHNVLDDDTRRDIRAVAVSTRPRPREDSYMPVFKAGITEAAAVSDALGVPLIKFSHQEGHIAAVKEFTPYAEENEILFYHISGGTTELLKVTDYFSKKGMKIEIIGGTKDISFGQLIDRIGVALGCSFPSGKEMDDSVQRFCELGEQASHVLTPITLDGLYFNLSGIESQTMRFIEEDEMSFIDLSIELFDKIAECFIRLTAEAISETGINRVVFGGGVSSSRYLRNLLKANMTGLAFGDYSADNAVGTALLGRNRLWH
jgi:Metal-dependent proteases with possible chaperone activity